MADTAGTITVKLHLDTTEFFAELARVQEAILELEGLGKDPQPATVPHRHHVALSYRDGKRELTLDGEPVKGVTSTTIALPANDFPTVTIALRAATVRCDIDGPTTLVADQPMVVETEPDPDFRD